ncbi:DoxX family protein [Glycomyces algeriensis]|uniref:Membrane protein n=1 Tax=Glycomyces algeriensis TaxID=256037 RepID=A0A9W6LIF5_9ACTN|nr:DoxX family protein [Glycomyces algeriensis]MDA1366716.1 DoxX family protein [Glycomyces algeriensis]MDR7351603.1 putative oxidoreductase [Glycomyces algeriensis]GLI44325.1 membrane protein [Glycomyces algeriensis]
MITRLQPIGLLIGRVVLGVVFIAHGWQKFSENGMDATVQGFEGLGIPAPTLSAYFTVGAEIIGGALLILGALLPLAGLWLASVMLGAMYFVHPLDGAFFSQEGGYEYVLLLAAIAIAIGFSGGGALAVDSLWLNNIGEKKEADEPARAESLA